MSCEGWVKLHRQIQENPLWLDEKFSRGQAWIDLILLANYKDNYFIKRGIKVNVLRGQCGWSELALSARWKWSRTRVRNFLKMLELEQQIHVEKSKVTQVVTIINYDKYQQKGQQKDNRRTTEGQQKDTNKKEKKEKNNTTGEKASPYSDRFETFWGEYPRKRGKFKAFSSWKKFKCDGDLFGTIMGSLQQQKTSEDWTRENGKYIPHGSTWVNGKKWEDVTESKQQSEWIGE